ncbi:NAD(P)H-dependent oxidoreductase [Phaeobacter sp. HF9A]|uniref:NAD(P)H-dependent oxidoreductase n=1 Tax=Phaeobacter sp. HF9A TaxID=2721561 RepID=UPI0014320E3C|nr:NAD(P)H-dependent oxidoreductase [Phaeobacter sp. HF9A]NIZ12135.1 NAD(P)H-dependent oxidoreductase [Phaeobacter sp. HF9A]
MSMRKILLLNGHPGHTSLNKSLAEAYRAAAEEAGHQLRYHDLSQMEFDSDYGLGGYANYKPLEPVLETFLTDLEWAEHVVITTPLWWGMLPAKLKGLFDRVLLPGRTFDTRNTSLIGLPAPMLSGKTARVILTMDTPPLFLRLAYSNAVKKILTRQILGFVGIKPTRFTSFAPASHPKENHLRSWLKKVSDLGTRAA